MARLTKSTVEQAALSWLEGLGWAEGHRPVMAKGDGCFEGLFDVRRAGDALEVRASRDSFALAVLDALRNYDVRPVLWSDREAAKQELAA